MTGPTREFWDARFQANDTPWDRGGINPQLHAWLNAKLLRPCRILVPGCGAGHEVVALAAAGFEVTALDYAPAALECVRNGLAASAQTATLVESDALAWRPDRVFDAIYEQTCLSALHPDFWCAYTEQLHRSGRRSVAPDTA